MNIGKNRRLLFSGVFLVIVGTLNISFAEDLRQNVLKTMQQELSRSMNELKYQEFERPYFITYRVDAGGGYNLRAKNGSLITSYYRPSGSVYVEVRVGNYKLDSSQSSEDFWERDWLGTSFPLDGNPDAIRRILWILSDKGYKKALFSYARKKGEKVSEMKEEIDDLWPESPHEFIDSEKEIKFDMNFWSERLKKISSLFLKYPFILDSEAALIIDDYYTITLNSEGTKVITEGSRASFSLSCNGLAKDGMPLNLYWVTIKEIPAELLNEKDMSDLAEEMCKKMEALISAPASDPYTGPAILDSESAGVLFHEAIGHRLEGEAQREESEGQTFKGKIGKKIIPDFLTIIDDPTQKEFRGKFLNGYYKFDDEGVPGEKALLVEKGVLRNFLLSRAPVRDFSRSNGHGRASEGYKPAGRMSNLFIESSKEYTFDKLKEMLIEECRKQGKPYGLIIKKMKSGDTTTKKGGYQAFRAIPQEVWLVSVKDGSETLVRGVEMVGTPLITVNKILATGKDCEATNSFCGGRSGWLPVSSISPSILVEQVELQRTEEKKERPPLLKAP
jgi:TldD protein